MSHMLNLNPLPQHPQQIDIKRTTEIVCENCSNNIFAVGVLLRKVSVLLSPSGRESVIQIPTHYCTSCGHVNDDFIPEELRHDSNPSVVEK